jgi:glycyl-tRNA synthetase
MDKLDKLISLAKRRGFIFQSSEIYGGLKSAYDYGPLGVELKRNIAAEWWKQTVHAREDVVGIDAAIMMHSKVWQASGHAAGFSDPLVDCFNCKERFRADKAPQVAAGTAVTFVIGGKEKGEKKTAKVSDKGYVCPVCSSPEFSEERDFNLMFQTSIGPVSAVDGFLTEIADKSLSRKELKELWEEKSQKSKTYLRPETAQAMFVQFLNVQQTQSAKIPFGIAQQGKSFRNEITTEKYIFRTCEFEQMEMEYFIEPGTEDQWLEYWKEERLNWWRSYANQPEDFKPRQHEADELAHYATNCYDIDYNYPWGFDELEGVASRTDYDLTKHTEHSGQKLTYFDQNKVDPETGKNGWRYTPYVIEPAAGLTRGVLAYLLDAYTEEEGTDATGNLKQRTVLKLHPKFAPIKVAVLPLTKKDGLPDKAREIVKTFFNAGINASYDEQHSIGKRYAKHDEIGTPYCLTIDHQSLEDNTLTLRDRDSTEQSRLKIDQLLETVKSKLA